VVRSKDDDRMSAQITCANCGTSKDLVDLSRGNTIMLLCRKCLKEQLENKPVKYKGKIVGRVVFLP
jgi:NMD protein affecting ribosome stability and mRNA decay